MIIELDVDVTEQELVDASESVAYLIEHAEEVELPPAAISLLVALDDALSRVLPPATDAA